MVSQSESGSPAEHRPVWEWPSMSSPTVLMILGAISHRTDFLNSELFLKNRLEMVLEISDQTRWV